MPPGGGDGSLPAMQETGVQSLGPEDPLEKEMATHSSLFAWEIPWTEEPGGLKESDMTERLTLNTNATRSHRRILNKGNMIQFVF